MARIETDPNYTAPTFSRATAASDLFKKEDVQALAAALSTHDHTSGKGVVVPIGTGQITSAMILDRTIQGIDIALATINGDEHIADGTISSAKIADGTLTAADLAANAVTQQVSLQPFGNFGPAVVSTTSPTYVNCAGLVITITCSGGNVLTVVTGNLGSTSAGSITNVGLKNDGAGPSLQARVAPLVANTASPFMLYGFWGPLSGAHTFQLAWQTSAGTATMDPVNSFNMYAIEFKR